MLGGDASCAIPNSSRSLSGWSTRSIRRRRTCPRPSSGRTSATTRTRTIPAIKPLLVTDPHKLDDPQKATYPGDKFGDALPLAWYQTFDGGREFYTALGHNIKDYANPILYNQILGGIQWAMGKE